MTYQSRGELSTAQHDEMPDLRAEVRAFVQAEAETGALRPGRQSWTTARAEFSEKCAARGYIAMTWPKEYGGHERSPLERTIVCEELLAASAPLGFHWIADRQSGPQLLRNGTETLKRRVLPEIAAGRCAFSIGMSEPDSGSDLSSIRTQADRVDGGWVINGRKIWTTNAHVANYMIVLCRTAPRSDNRHAGLSQLAVPMTTPGVSVFPIANLAGEHELNEVVFDDVFVDDDHLLGEAGSGWRLVTEELAFERSGPDRYLSTFAVLRLLTDALGPDPDRHAAVEVGRLFARLGAIRNLSFSIAAMLGRKEPVSGLATVMKELGTTLEQEIPDVARGLVDVMPVQSGDDLPVALALAILNAPSFSLRGGTREILKGIIAKEIGLR
ncbi:acyl-CoA dehydrogenase family protein [Actibacterium sp. D379-3]